MLPLLGGNARHQANTLLSRRYSQRTPMDAACVPMTTLQAGGSEHECDISLPVLILLVAVCTLARRCWHLWWWSQGLPVANTGGSTDDHATRKVASRAEGDETITQMSIGIFDRLPDDVLIMIVAQLYGRTMNDVNAWQARRDLRRRARVDVRWKCPIEQCLWDDLAPVEQSAAIALGYWDDAWDYGMMPPPVLKPWAMLSFHEFLAAWTLGYSPASWDIELKASDDMGWVLNSECRARPRL